MFRQLDQRKQQFYKRVAGMIVRINGRRSTIKSEIYKTEAPKRYHALLHKVLINYDVLRELVKKSDYMKDIPLGTIMVHEILTRNVKNDGFRRKFQRLLGDRKLESVMNKTFIRINPLKGKVEDFVDYELKETCIPNVFEVINSKTEEEIYTQAESYESNDESIDEKDVEADFSTESEDFEVEEETRTFKHTRDLFSNPEVLQKIKVQNFSSCLPPFVLNPRKDATIIDAAASPGNKTTHLSSIMENTGMIYAFERNMERYKNLVQNVEQYGATNIKTFHMDFLKVNPEDYKINYLLLDPSCSGSGIHTNYKKDQDRIDKLHNLQAMMLNHALKFNAEKVVYSVCSVHREEGEDVVKEALEKNPNYELEEIKDYTGIRGIEGYDFSNKVLRTKVTQSGDIGFFIALFKKKDI